MKNNEKEQYILVDKASIETFFLISEGLSFLYEWILFVFERFNGKEFKDNMQSHLKAKKSKKIVIDEYLNIISHILF